jgi:hypothetical protein
MIDQKRFGRKIALPSTVEIKRELVLMSKTDAIVDKFENEGGSSEELAAIVAGLIEERHISSERAQILINGFGRRKAAFATAS